MATTTVELYGVNLEVEFEYTPEQEGSFDEPAFPPELEISGVCHKGECIGMLLDDNAYDQIRWAILTEIDENRRLGHD